MFGSCKDKCGGGAGAQKNSKDKSEKSEGKFEQLINDVFKVGRKIGAGSYGQIHLGTNTRTNQTVAIKFEKLGHDMQLQTEAQVRPLLVPATWYQ